VEEFLTMTMTLTAWILTPILVFIAVLTVLGIAAFWSPGPDLSEGIYGDDVDAPSAPASHRAGPARRASWSDDQTTPRHLER
jgi:hypothetical protein